MLTCGDFGRDYSLKIRDFIRFVKHYCGLIYLCTDVLIKACLNFKQIDCNDGFGKPIEKDLQDDNTVIIVLI